MLNVETIENVEREPLRLIKSEPTINPSLLAWEREVYDADPVQVGGLRYI
jgi:hypothetical protein